MSRRAFRLCPSRGARVTSSTLLVVLRQRENGAQGGRLEECAPPSWSLRRRQLLWRRVGFLARFDVVDHPGFLVVRPAALQACDDEASLLRAKSAREARAGCLRAGLGGPWSGLMSQGGTQSCLS